MNYVWSKSLDNSSDGEDFEPNAAQPTDSTNPQLEYGPSNFNLPQRFTWIFGYDLPKMGGSMQKLKNGWGINSTLTLQSGQPFQFNYNFEDDYSGSGDGFDRPDVVGPIVYNKRDPAQFHGPEFLCDSVHGGTRSQTALRDSNCVPGTRHYGNDGPQLAARADLQRIGTSAIYKNTAIHRACESAAARRFLQHAEPSELRQSVPAGFHCGSRRSMVLHSTVPDAKSAAVAIR